MPPGDDEHDVVEDEIQKAFTLNSGTVMIYPMVGRYTWPRADPPRWLR